MIVFDRDLKADALDTLLAQFAVPWVLAAHRQLD